MKRTTKKKGWVIGALVLLLVGFVGPLLSVKAEDPPPKVLIKIVKTEGTNNSLAPNNGVAKEDFQAFVHGAGFTAVDLTAYFYQTWLDTYVTGTFGDKWSAKPIAEAYAAMVKDLQNKSFAQAQALTGATGTGAADTYVEVKDTAEGSNAPNSNFELPKKVTVDGVPRHAIYGFWETTTPTKEDNGKISKVISSIPTFVALPLYNPTGAKEELNTIYIYPKNEFAILEKKLNNSADAIAAIGADIKYEIKVKVPTDIARLKSLSVTEKPGAGLTITSFDSLTVGTTTYVKTGEGTKLDDNFTVTLTGELPLVGSNNPADNKTYLVKIAQKDGKGTEWTALAGQTVTLIFTGHINQDATAITTVGNGAEYKVTNTADVESEPTTTTTTTDTKTLDYQFQKNDSQTGKALTGAKFEVSNGSTFGTALSFVEVGTNSGVYRLAETGKSGTTPTLNVKADGTLKLIGLDNVAYTLKETEAPTGYRMDTATHTFTPKDRTEGDLDSDDETNDLDLNNNKTDTYHNIYNTPESVLPITGGAGLKVLMAVGVAGLAGAAGFYFLKKRQNQA
ncbi:MAG: SpaH/EbpB family LPXTG-anchored major pilin [Streptococcaceae bacterium]|jgi:fimbrial isopeptide formation D2 family protein/LPXTG-motif cell wall-anchored protein|nr:SpaH/EbpB family LPXTG-anchored major pilin [Streptococcaceae bacterium]